jgi:glycosyltransferase involved in cell wall biosynthesis
MDAVALCPFRRDICASGGQESATCDLLATAFGFVEDPPVRVDRELCAACCQADSPTDARVNNPVVASLIYGRAHDRLREQPNGPYAERFARLEAEAQRRLPFTLGPVNFDPGALRTVGVGERRLAVEPPASDRQLNWEVAVLAADRQPSTLAATLASLRDAGFDGVRLFAEPAVDLPASSAHIPVVRLPGAAGDLGSFVFAGKSLLAEQPSADCFAIFGDDVSAARGLRRWCEGQLWPGGHGVVSLYTCRALADDRAGWQTLNLGYFRTFGASAFVFRRDDLLAFVSDRAVAYYLENGQAGVDAVVGEWAFGRGIGIGYHTPSLVQVGPTATGTGRIGRADAVAAVDDVTGWRPLPARMGKVGLLGSNSPSGLGYQNRDIAKLLPPARWLAAPEPRLRRLWKPSIPGEYWAPWGMTISQRMQRKWLDGLDWMLFVEKPHVPGIVPLARTMGVSVACVPNWEWLSPDMEWLPYVDLMICPTEIAYRMLCRWRREIGFAWDVVHFPWPIEPANFPFRRRDRCRRFLFVNGSGGARGWRPDGVRTSYRRKGMHLVAAAAKLLPHIPFVAYSQIPSIPDVPRNMEVRRGHVSNGRLYDDGDICVQPSHWEGLGLQLLECQAAGMPVVTTDFPPMNECRPFRAVAAAETENVYLNGDQPIESQLIRPEDLAAVLESLYDTDIRDASEQARAYIERERSWAVMRDQLAALLPA